MHEELLEHHSPIIQKVHPEHLTQDELAAMQALYTTDAVETYQSIVEDPVARESLEKYFTDKAQSLVTAISDPNQEFWLVKQGSDVVGMAGYNTERHLIHSVYISRDVRGQGFGNLLMNSVLDGTSASLPRTRTIQVASANVRAINFYKSLDFEPTGRSKEWNIGGATIPEIEFAI